MIVSHLIDIVRHEPVDLMRIDAEAPASGWAHSNPCGHAGRDRIFSRFGSSCFIDLESDQYLFRVETVAISPPQQSDDPNPSMQLAAANTQGRVMNPIVQKYGPPIIVLCVALYLGMATIKANRSGRRAWSKPGQFAGNQRTWNHPPRPAKSSIHSDRCWLPKTAAAR